MDPRRVNISSGVRFESIVGYSRAVRVGPFVSVTGTTATGPDGEIVGVNDMYRQTRQAIDNILAALGKAGAAAADVVRTRIYVTDIARWAEVARAHRETFGDVMPATTMVEVSKLIDQRMLVEIEADAIVAS
ncbi:MAG: RidA family protein [Gemmatimonadales bacterium]